jgi:uncharacterized delta-60 repeat protein
MTKPSKWLLLLMAGVLLILFVRFTQPESPSVQQTQAPTVDSAEARPSATAAIGRPLTRLTSINVAAPDLALIAAKSNVVEIARPEKIDNRSFGSGWGKENLPELAAFSAWATDPNAAPALGVPLAAARRMELKRLIGKDPELAIAYAVPFMVRKNLPEAVVALLEETVSDRGQFSTLAVGFPKEPQPSHWIEAQVGDRFFRANTYGSRRHPPEYTDTPVHGIAIDRELALSEETVRNVSIGEALANTGVLPTSCSACVTLGNGGAHAHAAADIFSHAGSGLVRSCCAAHQHAHAGLVAGMSANEGAQGSDNVFPRPTASQTTGTNRILVIRVDFTDIPGTPVGFGGASITEQYVLDQWNMAGGMREVYLNSSFGKLDIQVTTNDVTSVLRMPQTSSVYLTNSSLMHQDGRNLAAGAGFTLANYNKIAVVFSDIGVPWAGLGSVNGPYFWMNGNWDVLVVTHELGHNYGLLHGNRWAVSTNSPPLGTAADLSLSPNDPLYPSREYGDQFEIMGNNFNMIRGNMHFNHWFKNYLHWYPNDRVINVTNSGAYRVFRFDDRSAGLNPTLALKVTRDLGRNYWIGHRALNVANQSNNIPDSAYVLWGYNFRRQSDLIVMNGDPSLFPSNAGLEVGQTFGDPAAGLTVRMLGTGGLGPGAYIDLQIDVEPRIDFQEPIYHVEQHVGEAVLMLNREFNFQNVIAANYRTLDGTAIAPTHYVATAAAAGWAALDSQPKPIRIPISSSPSVLSNATFSVEITNVTGGVSIFEKTSTVRIHAPGSTEPFLNPGFINSGVNRAVPLPNGDIVVGGNFTSIGGQAYGRVAKMDSIGTVLTNFPVVPGANNEVLDLFAQPDGKVVIGGTFLSVNGSFTEGYISRLDTNGQLDTNFNLTLRPNQAVRAVAVQPDGKILAGGPFTSVGGRPYRHLVRYNLDGSLDTNFVAVPFDNGTFYSVQDIALAPNGKVYIAGLFSIGGTNFTTLTNMHSGVVRLNSDGSIDTAFNIRQGAHFATLPTSPATVNAVHVKQDGDVLMGGEFTGFNSNTVSLVVRVNSDGSHDTNFISTVVGTAITTIAEQPDGKVLIGGQFTANGTTVTGNYSRLNADGTLDTTFWPGFGSVGKVRDIRYGSDHKILIAAEFGGINESIRPVAKLYAGVTTRPGVVQFSTPTGVAIEGNSATLTLTRTGGTDGIVSVNFGIFGGTGTNIVTGTSSSGTLVWNSGDSLPKSITVPITADNFAETNEIVNVAIGVPIGGVAIGTNQLVAISVADVPSAPVIVQNPVSVVANIGTTVTFTANAIGGLPLNYFWRFNGLNIPGVHGPTLTLTNVQPGQAGLYSLRVLNNQGFADSGSAVLAVNVPPTVTGHPLSQTVPSGGNVAFTVTATGNGPLTYQWQRNGVNIPSATVPILNLLNLGATNSGNYRVIVTNPYGSANSQAAVLTVDSVPVVIQHPRDSVVAEGGSSGFQVSVLGTVPFTYQWHQNGVPITGATNSSLSVSNVTGQTTGNYHALVTNVRGSTPSLPARLTVITEELTATWAASSGGIFADSGNAVALDSGGNAIVVGSFTSVANIGGTNLTSEGRRDLFIVKLDPVGGLIWGLSAGGKGYDSATDVAVDAAGNIVVVGSFEESIANFLGTNVVNSSVSSYSDIFVARFNPAGALQWVRTLGKQFEQDHPASVAIDAAGDIVVTGASMIDQFAGQPITNHGRALIAKYSGAGAELWALKLGRISTRVAAAPGAGGSVADAGHAVHTDASGNVYVALSMRSLTADFGGISLTNKGGADVVLMKLNNSGVTQWVKHAGGPNDDQVFGLAVGSDGSAFIAGDFAGVAAFGTFSLTNASAFLPDIFVAKTDANGNFVWAQRFGGDSADGARDLAVGSGDVIVMSGYFAGTVNFGSNTLTSVGGTLDAFAAQLTSAGQLVLVQQAGGSSSEGDLGLGVAIDSNGSIAMTGAFSGTGLVGSRQLSSAGSTDVFTTRFQAAGLSAITISFTQQPGELVLRWPSSAAGYFLQSTTSSPIHTNFSDIVGAPGTLGTNFVFTNATAVPRIYFRLRKP